MAAEESEKLKENEEAENPMLALDTNGVRKVVSVKKLRFPHSIYQSYWETRIKAVKNYRVAIKQ